MFAGLLKFFALPQSFYISSCDLFWVQNCNKFMEVVSFFTDYSSTGQCLRSIANKWLPMNIKKNHYLYLFLLFIIHFFFIFIHMLMYEYMCQYVTVAVKLQKDGKPSVTSLRHYPSEEDLWRRKHNFHELVCNLELDGKLREEYIRRLREKERV